MISLFWFLFWATLTALVVVSFLSLRRRLRSRLEQKRPRVDDDAVRRIVETGRLASEEDEPLDMEEIEEEERRFWSETWDEPEEW